MTNEPEEIRNFLNNWSFTGDDTVDTATTPQSPFDNDNGEIVVLRRNHQNGHIINNIEINNYNLKPNDVEGDVFDWIYSYLQSKKCPYSLSVALAANVSRQMATDVDNHNDTNESVNDNNSYFHKLLKCDDLYKKSMSKLDEMCLSYKNDPDEAIKLSNVHGQLYSTSICSMKNTRRKMEDRHVIIHNLNALFNIKNNKQYSYFAIFDGHAGVQAATYTAAHLHINLVNNDYFKNDDIIDGLREAFSITDLDYLEMSVRENIKSGTTAVACLFEDKNKLYIAWIGDSLAILYKDNKPIDVTYPHRPDNEKERERVIEMGGTVTCSDTWRVNDSLSITRAIGDPQFKPYISSYPEINEIILDGNEDFIILACDGLWDHLTQEEALELVYKHVSKSDQHDEIISLGETVSQVLAETAKTEGSTDNISVLVIFLRDLEELNKQAVKWLENKENEINKNTTINDKNSSLNPFASPFVPILSQVDYNDNYSNNPFSVEQQTTSVNEMTTKDNLEIINNNNNKVEDENEIKINNNIVDNVSDNITNTADNFCLPDESLIDISEQDIVITNDKDEHNVKVDTKITNGQLHENEHEFDIYQNQNINNVSNQNNIFSNPSADISALNESSILEGEESFFSCKNNETDREITMKEAFDESNIQFTDNKADKSFLDDYSEVIATQMNSPLIVDEIINAKESPKQDEIKNDFIIKNEELAFEHINGSCKTNDDNNVIDNQNDNIVSMNDLLKESLNGIEEQYNEKDTMFGEPLITDTTNNETNDFESIQYEYNVLQNCNFIDDKLPIIQETEKSIPDEYNEINNVEMDSYANEVPQLSHELHLDNEKPIESIHDNIIPDNEVTQISHESNLDIDKPIDIIPEEIKQIEKEEEEKEVVINDIKESNEKPIALDNDQNQENELIESEPSNILQITPTSDLKPVVTEFEQVITNIEPSFVVETAIAVSTTPDTSDADTEKDLDWKYVNTNNLQELNEHLQENIKIENVDLINTHAHNVQKQEEAEEEKQIEIIKDEIIEKVIEVSVADEPVLNNEINVIETPIIIDEVKPIIEVKATEEIKETEIKETEIKDTEIKDIKVEQEIVEEKPKEVKTKTEINKTKTSTLNAKPRVSLGQARTTATTKLNATDKNKTEAKNELPKAPITKRPLTTSKVKSSTELGHKEPIKSTTTLKSVGVTKTAEAKLKEKPRLSTSAITKTTIPPTSAATKSTGTSRLKTSVTSTISKTTLKKEPTEKPQVKEIKKTLPSKSTSALRSTTVTDTLKNASMKTEEKTTTSTAAAKPRTSLLNRTSTSTLNKTMAPRTATTRTSLTSRSVTKVEPVKTEPIKKTLSPSKPITSKVLPTKSPITKTTSNTTTKTTSTSTLRTKTTSTAGKPATTTTTNSTATTQKRPVNKIQTKNTSIEKKSETTDKLVTVERTPETIITDAKPMTIVSERISKRDKLSSSSLKDELEAAMELESPSNHIKENHNEMNGLKDD